MFGNTIKKLRIHKGLTQQELAGEIITKGQLSKIENKDHIPSAETFIELLLKLNVNFEEFYQFSENVHIKNRIRVKTKFTELMKQRKYNKFPQLIKELNELYEKYDDIYFLHYSCLIKGFILYNEDSKSPKFSVVMDPVKSHLDKIKNWGIYEMSLFSNTFFAFSKNEVYKFANKAVKQINSNYEFYQTEEISRALLNNLASYSNSNGDYFKAFNFASKVLGFPQSITYMNQTLTSKIHYQIASFKLDNGHFDAIELKGIIESVNLMGYNDLYQDWKKRLKSHGIEL